MIQEIEMKRGNSQNLSGNLLAYACISDSALREAEQESSPFVDMVRGGLLAIAGDFRTQRSLRDFLNDMAGSNTIEKFKERLSADHHLPEDFDLPSFLKQRENLERLDAIPVPSQIVGFDSEEELLQSDADIFFLGNYHSLNNAHLVLSSFPILYQGFFREADLRKVRAEIDALLRDIEQGL